MSGRDETREGGFFSSWSRRKLAAKRQEAPKSPAIDEEIADESPRDLAAPEVELDEEAIAALPSIDSITAATDIKPFLAAGIPTHLKNAALRRIWSVTPGVRDYSDPAVDYAWDWNAPGGVPGGGGSLSDAGVARMVRDLIGGLREGEAGHEAVEDEAESVAAAAAEPETPEADAPAPPEPVRRTVAASPERPVAEDVPRETAQVRQSRRHGGAVPE